VGPAAASLPTPPPPVNSRSPFSLPAFPPRFTPPPLYSSRPRSRDTAATRSAAASLTLPPPPPSHRDSALRIALQ